MNQGKCRAIGVCVCVCVCAQERGKSICQVFQSKVRCLIADNNGNDDGWGRVVSCRFVSGGDDGLPIFVGVVACLGKYLVCLYSSASKTRDDLIV